MGRRRADRGRAASSLAAIALVVALAGGARVGAAEVLDEAPPDGLELIHIEANEGGSSGGHVALALGDDVYHLQARDRLLVMTREPWTTFLTHYSSLENRTLRRLPIRVTPADLRRIRAAFERRRRIQTRQLDILDALEDERDWIAAQIESVRATLPVRGAGLFARETGGGGAAPSALALRAKMARRLGGDRLSALRSAAESDAARPAAPSEGIDAEAWQRDRMPRAEPTAVERLREALAWREALEVLDEGRPLAAERLVDPLGDGGRRLTEGERAWLASGLARLEDRIARLLVSERPDRGRALLVAIARHRAAERSLGDGRLWTLDPFDDRAERFDPDLGDARRRAVAALARDFGIADGALRDRLSADPPPPSDESTWQSLEELAARHAELEHARSEGRPIRVARSPVVPWPRAPLAAPPVRAPDGLEAALRQVERERASARAALRRIDGYALLDHNCATELARLLESPFGDRVETALGGRLEADRGLAFVPTLLFDRAAERLRVGPVRRVAPYRERRLADMRRRENDLVVWLREGNTLTARSYDGSVRDGYFLFFTDGTAALRPLGGAANLVYGLVNAGAGLVTWPFDGGRRLLRGARGAFFSFPELVFVDIRKGRFEYTADVSAALTRGAPSR